MSQSPISKAVVTEDEKFPLLGVVTRQLLVKTLQAGKDLVCVIVICKVWKLGTVL
jgi:hypothetical protein